MKLARWSPQQLKSQGKNPMSRTTLLAGYYTALKPIALGKPLPFAVIFTVVIFGDFLLWSHLPKLALALFLGGLVVLHIILYSSRVSLRRVIWGALSFCIGILPLLEAFNVLSVLFALAGTFAALTVLRDQNTNVWPEDWSSWLDSFVTAIIMAPFRFPILSRKIKRPSDNGWKPTAHLVGWVLPILFTCVFVGLFAVANPVWEKWLDANNLEAILAAIFSYRSLFWVSLIWFAWPFLEHKMPIKRLVRSTRILVGLSLPSDGTPDRSERNDAFFKRCLILFNLVFAMQSMLDLTYLWVGSELPDGMTHASYVHRGAYPLVAAAIIAGLFVIIAMRPNGPGERDVTIKWLVLAWVAQNILLVASSVFRLELYIETYALTYWRIAALIWMFLVMAGLALIVARFSLGRSTGWLVSANVLTLVTTLYVTSFINFPQTIAHYNLSNPQVSEKHIYGAIDRNYISQLGAFALPALIEIRQSDGLAQLQKIRLKSLEKKLLADVAQAISEDWRSWSFRGQRLKWFIEAQGGANDSRQEEVEIMRFVP